MSLKFAFAGFRHNHILGLYQHVKSHASHQLVAACEEDPHGAGHLTDDVSLTHDRIADMIETSDCDVVAVGDYFGKRGAILIQALKAGKHVIADKPICTTLQELAEIEALAKSNHLKVGCLLDMRDSALGQTLYHQVRSEKIGKIHAISFGGQHPLLYGERPEWYFEPGQFGGVINDIAVHAIDLLEWITQREIVAIHGSRCWNARLPQYPHVQECGQMMLAMDDGCGILGDVSYLAPDSQGYKTPYYWRFTMWGEQGVIEASWNTPLRLNMNGDLDAIEEDLLPAHPLGYLESFLRDIQGNPDDLNTQSIIQVSRKTLQIQNASQASIPLDNH